MVLTYRDAEEKNDTAEDGRGSIDSTDDNQDEPNERRIHQREVFEQNLKEMGLELELEPSQVS